MSRKGIYLETFSGGGLTSPSEEFSDFVSLVLAQSEVIDKLISCQQHVGRACCANLDKYALNSLFNYTVVQKKGTTEYILVILQE